MRKVIVLAVFLLSLSTTVYAHKLILPEEKDRNNALGAGVDLIVYESSNQVYTVETQTKYDTQNGDKGAWSNYLVGRINVWKLFKK